MKKQTIIIVGNGDTSWIRKKDLIGNSWIIGVDKAAYTLLKLGVSVDIAIGDFDSTSKKELEEIKHRIRDVREFPADKDKTDLELGVVVAMEMNPPKIVLYGCTGKRLDHELSALHLLQKIHTQNVHVILRDEHNEMRLVEGESKIKKSNEFPFLSILPFTDDIEVSISGCQYPLIRKVMKKGTTLGVSNIIISQYAKITVHKGIAYCILSRDSD